MNQHRLKFICALIVAAQLGVLAGCQKSDDGAGVPASESRKQAVSGDCEAKEARQGVTLTAAEAEVAGLKVSALEERQVEEQVVVTATIQPNQDRLAHVAPRVPSRIVKVAAKLGDKVRQGQALALLDSIELGEAHSAYLKARTKAQLAQRNLERVEGLYKEQIVPQKEYLRVRAEAEIADAAARAAADRVRLLGVDPAAERGNAAVSTFPLVSPFSGTITEKHAILGELAEPDKSLFTVADLSLLWIEANVFEADLPKVRVGSKAGVTVAAYPGETFSGRVAYISDGLDKETRTVRTRIEVSNPSGRLKPEMFATAAIDAGSARKVLAVPDEAVVLLQGQATVFVQAVDGFEPRPVQTGDKLRGEAVIKSGIKAGERIVTSGAYALKAKLLKSQIGDAH